MVIPSVQPNQQRCATCQYWKGERRIKTLNSREKVVEPLSFDGECPMLISRIRLNFNQVPTNSVGCTYNGGSSSHSAKANPMRMTGHRRGTRRRQTNGLLFGGHAFRPLPQTRERVLNAGAEINGCAPVTFEELLENNASAKKTWPGLSLNIL